MKDEKIMAYIRGELSKRGKRSVEKWIEKSSENEEHYIKLKIMIGFLKTS